MYIDSILATGSWKVHIGQPVLLKLYYICGIEAFILLFYRKVSDRRWSQRLNFLDAMTCGQSYTARRNLRRWFMLVIFLKSIIFNADKCKDK